MVMNKAYELCEGQGRQGIKEPRGRVRESVIYLFITEMS